MPSLTFSITLFHPSIMTNPFLKKALEITELEERYELTGAAADVDKLDNIHIVIDLT